VNIFKVSCYSKCSSYFSSYLQSVTVIADTKEDAVKVVKKWLNAKDESFIYPESTWDVWIKETDIKNNMVIDFFKDSDY